MPDTAPEAWTAIVTGASRGIGAAAAQHLGRAGANVVLVARDRGSLGEVAEVVRSHGGDPLVMALDIGAPHAAETAVRRTVSVFGRIDSLLNNAGVMDPIGPIARLDLTAWRRSFEINLFAALALTVEALPHLRAARGRVVTTVTALAHRPVRSLGAYSASKAAVLQATRVLAKEEDEVVCCAYSPGPVDTGMMAQLRDGGEGAIPEEETAGFRQMYEQGRLATAADAGRVLAWLALHATDEHRGQMVERGDRNVQAASASWLAKG